MQTCVDHIDISRAGGPGFDSRSQLLEEAFYGSLSSRVNAEVDFRL